ncbi:TPA: hypothetical protein HA244_05665 [Candidatus Micrarchaeota archaeon]|nr:hypothetical protein [Candidatus Micrarchaeota archaeon]
MKGLHLISVGVIAIAILLLAYAFISITGKLENSIDNAPQTGLFVAQAPDGQQDGVSASDCITDPRKCVNDSDNGSKTPAG